VAQIVRAELDRPANDEPGRVERGAHSIDAGHQIPASFGQRRRVQSDLDRGAGTRDRRPPRGSSEQAAQQASPGEIDDDARRRPPQLLWRRHRVGHDE
jgi:hypothetical protein